MFTNHASTLDTRDSTSVSRSISGRCPPVSKSPLSPRHRGPFHTPSVPTGAPATELIQRLQRDIDRVESAQRAGAGKVISSGCDAVNRLLPGYGYPPGCLVQWLTGGGQGADYLSLLSAREACRDGGALVVIDPWHQFYPPAAAAIGIEMANLIILRNPLPTTQADQTSDLLWSIDQALRCSAVGAVWGPLDRIDERWFRRFQLSAESSGCLGLFIQSIAQARQPTWAEVQWLVTPRSSPPVTTHESESSRQPPPANRACQQHLRLQLTRCRGAQTGKSIELTIDSIHGNVSPFQRSCLRGHVNPGVMSRDVTSAS